MATGIIKPFALEEKTILIGDFTIPSGSFYCQDTNVNVSIPGYKLISAISVVNNHGAIAVRTAIRKSSETSIILTIFTFDSGVTPNDITDSYMFTGLYQKI